MGLCDKFFTKQPSAWNLANRLMINRTLPFLKGDRCSKPSFVFICGVHSRNLMVRPWKSHLPKRKVSSSNHHFSGESVDRHPKQPPWMYKDLVNNGINYHLVSWILNFRGVSTSIFGGVSPCILFDHIIREPWSLEGFETPPVCGFFCGKRIRLQLFLDQNMGPTKNAW